MKEGESKKIVIESIERMKVRLIVLKKLIEEYSQRNERYIPTIEFLDYLGQVESTINYLISMMELSNALEERKGKLRIPKSDDVSAGYS